jgi:hypothetical protein
MPVFFSVTLRSGSTGKSCNTFIGAPLAINWLTATASARPVASDYWRPVAPYSPSHYRPVERQARFLVETFGDGFEANPLAPPAVSSTEGNGVAAEAAVLTPQAERRHHRNSFQVVEAQISFQDKGWPDGCPKRLSLR